MQKVAKYWTYLLKVTGIATSLNFVFQILYSKVWWVWQLQKTEYVAHLVLTVAVFSKAILKNSIFACHWSCHWSCPFSCHIHFHLTLRIFWLSKVTKRPILNAGRHQIKKTSCGREGVILESTDFRFILSLAKRLEDFYNFPSWGWQSVSNKLDTITSKKARQVFYCTSFHILLIAVYLFWPDDWPRSLICLFGSVLE